MGYISLEHTYWYPWPPSSGMWLNPGCTEIMGTRPLIYFQEKWQDGTIFIVIYQQLDGYLARKGIELATFLKGIKMADENGIVSEYKEGDIVCYWFSDISKYIQKQQKQLGIQESADRCKSILTV